MRLRYFCLFLLLASCHKQEAPKTSKGQKEEASLKLNHEREALNDFAAAVRKVFEWQHSQPATNAPATVKELTEKLQAVPAKGLPTDLKQAWEAMLQQWISLSTAMSSSQPPTELQRIQAKGKQAADTLNHLLAGQGMSDLHF